MRKAIDEAPVAFGSYPVPLAVCVSYTRSLSCGPKGDNPAEQVSLSAEVAHLVWRI
jgi:hypothetical protein